MKIKTSKKASKTNTKTDLEVQLAEQAKLIAKMQAQLEKKDTKTDKPSITWEGYREKVTEVFVDTYVNKSGVKYGRSVFIKRSDGTESILGIHKLMPYLSCIQEVIEVVSDEIGDQHPLSHRFLES